MTDPTQHGSLPPIAQLFCRLVTIPSPSGEELRVSQFIQSRMDMLGIASKFDASGTLNESNAGNLIVHLPSTVGPEAEHVLLVAHVDTVEVGDQRIIPVIEDGLIRSRDATILGADNKSGVAGLIEALAALRQIAPRPHVTAAFTTREESGAMGVRYLKVPEGVRYAFALDGSEPVGTVYTAARGQLPFEIEIESPDAHAALLEADDTHSLKIAAEIIGRLQFGNRPDGSTLTLGIVQGGTAINTVPSRIVLRGEMRAFEDRQIQERTAELRAVCQSVESARADIRIRIRTYPDDGAPAFVSQDARTVEVAERAAELTGVAHCSKRELFTSEVNALTAHDGLTALGVCTGGSGAHTHQESIAVEELLQCKDYVVNLVRSTVSG